MCVAQNRAEPRHDVLVIVRLRCEASKAEETNRLTLNRKYRRATRKLTETNHSSALRPPRAAAPSSCADLGRSRRRTAMETQHTGVAIANMCTVKLDNATGDVEGQAGASFRGPVTTPGAAAGTIVIAELQVSRRLLVQHPPTSGVSPACERDDRPHATRGARRARPASRRPSNAIAEQTKTAEIAAD